MKKTDEKHRVDQFFKNLKQYMKSKGKQIKFSDFIHFHRDEGLLSKLIDFLSQRIRMHAMTQSLIEEQLKKMLSERKMTDDQFKIQKNCIQYISKFKNIINEQSLIKQIQKYPQGLYVDDQLLKLTFDDIKQSIRSIIQKRKVLFIKSKQMQKQRNQQKYLGYILFAYPLQIRDYATNLFKIKASDIQKQIQHQRKLQRRFQLKTFQFRDIFQKSCKQNHNKVLIQNRTQIQNNDKKINSQWQQINRSCIQNYDQLIQEHMKKMAKK